MAATSGRGTAACPRFRGSGSAAFRAFISRLSRARGAYASSICYGGGAVIGMAHDAREGAGEVDVLRCHCPALASAPWALQGRAPLRGGGVGTARGPSTRVRASVVIVPAGGARSSGPSRPYVGFQVRPLRGFA